ncbi:MAG: right-handed parallel beta-helix repeat-containing protein, partial [Pyrinomonadaceae bacterium]|nr:right-handed parallel beta-helix repeat-containing protein [Pyrinomonadaceae bacterium]
MFASLVATGWTSSPAQANTIFVPSGGNFQAALNTAQPGDTILLEAGGTFIGPFVLPNKPGANWITVRTSAPDTSLPGPNTRITPAYSGVMPKLVSVGLAEPVLSTAPYSHHFRFIGIEFKQASSAAFLYDLILLGDGGGAQNTLDNVPHNIVIDRCYIHAADDGELKRGIALNSASTEIINSHISSFKGVGYDSQAIAGWNGPGPYRIENNYLEGAGENVMFGGATGGLAAQGLIPSDIVIRRNHFRKPLAWRGQWTVKNLLELKNARRVVIDGNLFEGCWADAQVGYAILFTPRPNDSGWAAVVEDVEFTNNTVRQVAAGIHIAGRDSLFSDPNSPRGRRIRVANNLLEIEGWPYDGDGCFLKLGDGANQVTIEHNTILQVGNLTKVWGAQATGFVFRNNLARHNQYGFFGDSAGFGTVALTTYFPGAIFTRNLMTKESGALWNVETFYP